MLQFMRKAGLLFVMCFLFSNTVVDAADVTREDIEKELTKAGLFGFTVDINVKIKVPVSENPYIETAKYAEDEKDAYIFATVIQPRRVLTEGPQPTILVATAYKKEVVSIQAAQLVTHGYNVVLADMRGSGGASGHWYSMSFIEQYDVKYLIDKWIPSQSWSNGDVGMIGGSYTAILELLAAGIVDCDEHGDPLHLKACIATVPMSDAYADIAVQGGTFELEFMAVWMVITEVLNILPSSLFLGEDATFPYPLFPLNVKDAAEATGDILTSLSQFMEPFNDFIIESHNEIRNNEESDFLWQLSPMIYWPTKPEGGYDIPSALLNESERSISDKLPILLLGGWFDIFTRGTTNYYQYGLSKHRKEDKGLIIGEWYHVQPFMNLGMGYPAFITLNFYARWFNWKIREKNDPFMVDHPVLMWVMGEDRWRAEQDWPLPESRTDEHTLYFSKYEADSIEGDWFTNNDDNQLYSLVEDKTDVGFEKENPVMKHSTDPGCIHGLNSRSLIRWMAGIPALLSEFPEKMMGLDVDKYCFYEDERTDEWRIPTFTTAPLEEDMEITGPLTVRFWAKTEFKKPSWWGRLMNQPLFNVIKNFFAVSAGNDALERVFEEETVQWVVELNDVFPSGRAKNITSGWLRASCRPYDPDNPSGNLVDGVVEHPADPDYTPFDPFYFGPTSVPVPIREGELYEYIVELWPTSNVFKKGHRIRISLTGSDFPHLAPIFIPSWNTIVIDETHEARVDFKTVNAENEGDTWYWISPAGKRLDTTFNDYLLHHADTIDGTTQVEKDETLNTGISEEETENHKTEVGAYETDVEEDEGAGTPGNVFIGTTASGDNEAKAQKQDEAFDSTDQQSSGDSGGGCFISDLLF